MRTTEAPLGLLLLLACSCQGFEIVNNCRGGSNCRGELNGYDGPVQATQACTGASCSVDFGKTPNTQNNQAVNRNNQNNQRFPQNNQNNQNNQRFPQNNQNNQRFPQNNQRGSSNVKINDICESGSTCSQNIGAGQRVQSTQSCTGSQCGVNYNQGQPGRAGGQGAGGQANTVVVGNDRPIYTSEGSNSGSFPAGGNGGSIEKINCGKGILRVETDINNIIVVTCNGGNKKSSSCPGAFATSNDKRHVTVTCGGALTGSSAGNQRRRGGNRNRGGNGGSGGQRGGGGGGGRRGGGGGQRTVINRNCNGNSCSINYDYY